MENCVFINVDDFMWLVRQSERLELIESYLRKAHKVDRAGYVSVRKLDDLGNFGLYGATEDKADGM